MLIYRYIPASVTTSSGEWAGNTLSISGGLCKQVFVKSASGGTLFTVTITDRFDNIVREMEHNTGLLNDLTEWPVDGIYTVAITSASADEAFNVEMLCRTN